jgi:hypothetical protein
VSLVLCTVDLSLRDQSIPSKNWACLQCIEISLVSASRTGLGALEGRRKLGLAISQGQLYPQLSRATIFQRLPRHHSRHYILPTQSIFSLAICETKPRTDTETQFIWRLFELLAIDHHGAYRWITSYTTLSDFQSQGLRALKSTSANSGCPQDSHP